MKLTDETVRRSFFVFLAAWPAVAIMADLWLYGQAPDATLTISWAMALWGYGHPLQVFFLGGIVFAVPVGLGVHFFSGQPTPKLWAKMMEMATEIKNLNQLVANQNAEITRLRKESSVFLPFRK